jgi:FtsZ-binding cell division protein ZapB
MEKKLTDDAEMNVGMTDEEIAKALDICYNDVHCSVDCPYFNLNGRNFCQDKELYKDLKRIVQEHSAQKAEIERLASLYDGKGGFMTSSIGDLPLTVEGLRKAVDEISRLLIVQGELQDLNVEYYNDAKDLRREVDELKSQNEWLTNEKDYLKECADAFLGDYRNSVKDTAKEILGEIGDSDILIVQTQEYGEIEVVPIERLKEIIKRKGVEVE